MKLLTWQEAQGLGVILEVNRRLLHQRGLALQIALGNDPDDHTVSINLTESFLDSFIVLLDWAGEQSDEWNKAAAEVREVIAEARRQPTAAHVRIQDHRDDPEGVYFDDLDAEDMAKAERFEALSKTAARLEGLGYFTQPLEITSA